MPRGTKLIGSSTWRGAGLRVDQQPTYVLPLVPDWLMNRGEIGGFGGGDVVEATH